MRPVFKVLTSPNWITVFYGEKEWPTFLHSCGHCCITSLDAKCCQCKADRPVWCDMCDRRRGVSE